MSKISLAPNAAGTAIFTIESPGTSTNRTLTLPDDTGTIVTNSGNQAGSFTTLNTSGAVVFNDAGADVDFRVEGDGEANLLFVDASADAVIVNGTVAAGSTGGLTLNNTTSGSVATQLALRSSGTGNGSGSQIGFRGVSNTGAEHDYGYVTVVADDTTAKTGSMRFSTTAGSSPVERARITSGGFFKAKGNEANYINTAAPNHEFIAGTGNNIAMRVRHTAADPYGCYTEFSSATPDNTTNYFEAYEDPTNLKAILYSNGSWQVRANSYGGISDVKLKQDIVDANSQWDDIKGLRIRKYRFKDEVAADPDYPSHIGIIAQEAELVSPGLVFESPDFENVEVPVLDDEGNPVLDEDGNPQVTTERQATGTVTKGVKYSILYMKAVKALQEAMERIETLEASNTALEARIAALETGA